MKKKKDAEKDEESQGTYFLKKKKRCRKGRRESGDLLPEGKKTDAVKEDNHETYFLKKKRCRKRRRDSGDLLSEEKKMP